ncbi:MAG: CsbD family protein [Sphingomonadaceae bacterium]|jgi:uncharacterized protein YjbJ (UPF0337 family)
MGEVVDKVKGATNEAIGKMKQQSSNPETRGEGRAQQMKGEAQKISGSVKGAMGNKL